MLKMKDILPGDCWRFTEKNAPDNKPTVTMDGDRRETKLADVPSDWDWWSWEKDDTSGYMKDHGERPIELLHHYSTHPEPVALDLRRRHLAIGDCFRYEGSPQNYVVVKNGDRAPMGAPGSWNYSDSLGAIGCMDQPVRRVPRWDGTYWKPTEEPPAPSLVLATSPCGAYVLVAGRDVPLGAARSSGNVCMSAAMKYQQSDCRNVAHGGYTAKPPSDDRLYWIRADALTTTPALPTDDGGVDATTLCDGDIVTHIRMDAHDTWEKTDYCKTPLRVLERYADGRAKVMVPDFGQTVRANGTPWRVKVIRAAQKPAAPVVLPCVDPLEGLRSNVRALRANKIENLTGAQCLEYMTMAQRTESVVRDQNGQFFSTHGNYMLTARQFQLGRDVWEAELRVLAAEAKLRRDTERARNVCDDPDEMPNMADA